VGILKSCYAVNGESVEVAVFELYDEPEAINVTATNPGMDDLLGEPFLDDAAAGEIEQGIPVRVRPGQEVEVKAKAKWNSHEEQDQDGTGNEPSSFLVLTIYESDLIAKGIMVNGKVRIRANDRLLRIKSSTTGAVRVDFEVDRRDGLHVVEVRPGETGTGIYTVMLVKRRSIAQ